MVVAACACVGLEQLLTLRQKNSRPHLDLGRFPTGGKVHDLMVSNHPTTVQTSTQKILPPFPTIGPYGPYPKNTDIFSKKIGVNNFTVNFNIFYTK